MTDRQRAFVDAYVGQARFNATAAARIAGYEQPQVQGPRLKSDPEVRAAIEARLIENTLSANEVLSALTDQARGSMGDFITVDDGYTRIDLSKAEQSGKMHLLKSYEISKAGIKLELYDAQNALVQLGRHYKLFSDGIHADLDSRIEHLLADLAELGPQRQAEAAGDAAEEEGGQPSPAEHPG